MNELLAKQALDFFLTLTPSAQELMGRALLKFQVSETGKSVNEGLKLVSMEWTEADLKKASELLKAPEILQGVTGAVRVMQGGIDPTRGLYADQTTQTVISSYTNDMTGREEQSYLLYSPWLDRHKTVVTVSLCVLVVGVLAAAAWYYRKELGELWDTLTAKFGDVKSLIPASFKLPEIIDAEVVEEDQEDAHKHTDYGHATDKDYAQVQKFEQLCVVQGFNVDQVATMYFLLKQFPEKQFVRVRGEIKRAMDHVAKRPSTVSAAQRGGFRMELTDVR